jgi:hypothetical protein
MRNRCRVACPGDSWRPASRRQPARWSPHILRAATVQPPSLLGDGDVRASAVLPLLARVSRPRRSRRVSGHVTVSCPTRRAFIRWPTNMLPARTTSPSAARWGPVRLPVSGRFLECGSAARMIRRVEMRFHSSSDGGRLLSDAGTGIGGLIPQPGYSAKHFMPRLPFECRQGEPGAGQKSFLRKSSS